MCLCTCLVYTGRMGNIQEALKLITERLQDVNKVNPKRNILVYQYFLGFNSLNRNVCTLYAYPYNTWVHTYIHIYVHTYIHMY